jgi:hypothetical protein
MYKKFVLVIAVILVSPVLFAQGKLYIVPHIGFHSGAYKGVDSVNDKQNFIKTKPFLRKDFIIGFKLTYTYKSLGISAGIEQGVYSSGFYRNEDKSLPYRIDSKHTASEGNGPTILFIEPRYELFDFNIKMPKWLSNNPEKPYLVASRIAPFLGVEYRKMSRTFINDFVERNITLTTSQYGDIPATDFYHAYKTNQISFRGGIDWIFYNLEKRKFVITLMYSFAFKDAGYFRYHFYKPGIADFYFQTQTRGNGISLKAGIPIKLVDFGKNKNRN